LLALSRKFVAQLKPGRQACRPSHVWLCLKDWANIGTYFTTMYCPPQALGKFGPFDELEVGRVRAIFLVGPQAHAQWTQKLGKA
jgi:hypothetical protein